MTTGIVGSNGMAFPSPCYGWCWGRWSDAVGTHAGCPYKDGAPCGDRQDAPGRGRCDSAGIAVFQRAPLRLSVARWRSAQLAGVRRDPPLADALDPVLRCRRCGTWGFSYGLGVCPPLGT
jgi:hypothetical protein